MGGAKARPGLLETAFLVFSPESSAKHTGQCPSGARVEWEKGRECRFDIALLALVGMVLGLGSSRNAAG